MMKTKNILLTTSLLALLLGNTALAGEPTHFFRDPLNKDKNFRLNQSFDKETEKTTQKISKATAKKEVATQETIKQSFVLKKINLVGNKSINFADLQETIAPYMGKKLNIHSVSITRAIENHYRKQGYLLPTAEIESSNSNTGSITVKVVEGKIRTVLVETDQNSQSIKNNELLKKHIEAIVNLTPAKTKDVQRYLLLIEKIPGYQIEYQLRPISPNGAELADLVIAIKKSRGSLSFDATNHGNKDLGRYQFSGFAKLNNPFGYNESIILSTGTSNHSDSLKLASLGYLKRLNAYGTSVNLLGSWLQDNPFKHSATKKGHASDNKNFTFKGSLAQYLVLNNANSFKLEVGAEYKDVETNIIGQKSIDYDYTMAFVKAKIKHVDCFSGENWFIPTVNRTTNHAKIRLYEQGAYVFDKNFSFYTLDWFRDQPLFKSNFSLYTQVMYQGSSDNLPVEHQFFIGSNSVGRAYKSGLINANKGSAADMELRYTKEVNNRMINVVQPYIYADVAHFNTNKAITNNETTTSSFSKKTFYSAGGGVRLFFPYQFNGEVEAAIPLDKKLKINNVETRNKNKYSFLVSKTFSW